MPGPGVGEAVQALELGGVRLHLLTLQPGLPGEADRVARELDALDPAVLAADADTDDALRLREAAAAHRQPFHPSFVDALYRDEVARRFGAGAVRHHEEHPLLAAARFARSRKASLVPLRPVGGRPGFFARRRARAAAADATAGSPDDYADAFARALAAARAWDARAEVDAAQARLSRALTDGRAPVVALVQAHRARAFRDALAATRWIPA